ncbi:unnamed protein product [Cuscuta campestris]|uniref:Uncharacterized protein n=1 Tax=Cuscuta campestris TaxID=132261 RepID=A0A484MML0_9ASTE|nr:unnamed protein product [Cuscuta campestris]
MRPFGEAKSISGHQTLQLMRRPYGSVYVVTLPAFQRCLEDRATTRERIPHRQGDRRRPSRGTSRPTGNTGETWEGNPIGSQRIHSTCSQRGEGISFLQRKKNGADLTRHNLTIHPIPMICA